MSSMEKLPRHDLQRVRFYNGGLLTGRDLGDDLAWEALQRRMHHRVMHATWGIALGLTARLTEAQTLQVAPGLAYDGLGREIILAETLEFQVPSTLPPEGLILAVGHREEPAPEGAEAVWSEGLPTPAPERPVFLWRPPGKERKGSELPLVRIYGAQADKVLLDLSVRLNAWPLTRPHIAGGVEKISLMELDESQEFFWKESVANQDQYLGFKFAVKTAGAGFTRAPLYFATAQFSSDLQKLFLQHSPLWYESLDNVSPDGFTYRILRIPRPQARALASPAGLWEAKEEIDLSLTISWVGFEEVAGFEPRLHLQYLYVVQEMAIMQTFLPQMAAILMSYKVP